MTGRGQSIEMAFRRHRGSDAGGEPAVRLDGVFNLLVTMQFLGGIRLVFRSPNLCGIASYVMLME